jgi:C-terminal processing protease CtpA/Prc
VTRLRAEYLDPEKGETMADALEARDGAHAYDGMGGEAFADAVTQDMRDLCSDTHLRLLYSEEVIPLDAGDDAPETSEAQERRVEEWKHANFGFLRLERWPGNVGYLDLDMFADPQFAGGTAAAAMQFLANTDAIVIDLRYNHGGHGTMVAFLASYFVDGAPVHLNDYYWRSENRMKQSWTLPWVPGPRLFEQPLFLVTSARTHSAAEEFCYDLQTLGRARVVGERTRGGAHPSARYRLHDHFGVMIPIARAVNPTTGTNWEGTGITPDVSVAADRALAEARILATEAAAARADDPELRGELDALAAKLRAEAGGAPSDRAEEGE